MSKQKFFITNAIPYVNAKPHVGHALEFIQSDAIARYQRLLGKEVLLLCGGDENAIKNVQAAEKAAVPLQEFIDTNTQLFLDLSKKLNVHFDVFQKGSSSQHHKSSQELWERCKKNGDIYKKAYKGLYCVGCELFYEKDELDEHGECFEHPGRKLEEVTEENYFFKLSNYQDQLEQLVSSEKIKIIPESRKNEVLSFIRQGLKDISISRSNLRAKNWGVPVPGDDTQRMYVWFDALNIYQSGIGFGSDEKKYQKWWPANVHVIGKGIIRFHAIYWPAFLLSAGLKVPESIFAHGYLTVDGQKMSKSIGNVVDPLEIVEKYGTDVLRFYLLREVPSTGDGDFSESRLKEVYTSDLANGLGNLVSRVAKLSELIDLSVNSEKTIKLDETYTKLVDSYKFNESIAYIWEKITKADQTINQEKPWELVKNEKEKATKVLTGLVETIQQVALLLSPFMPETAEKIEEQFKGPSIASSSPLFPRL